MAVHTGNLGEVVMANASLLRSILVYLLAAQAIPPGGIELIFDRAKGDLKRYDPRAVEGASRFLDHQRESIDLSGLPPSHKPH